MLTEVFSFQCQVVTSSFTKHVAFHIQIWESILHQLNHEQCNCTIVDALMHRSLSRSLIITNVWLNRRKRKERESEALQASLIFAIKESATSALRATNDYYRFIIAKLTSSGSPPVPVPLPSSQMLFHGGKQNFSVVIISDKLKFISYVWMNVLGNARRRASSLAKPFGAVYGLWFY